MHCSRVSHSFRSVEARCSALLADYEILWSFLVCVVAWGIALLRMVDRGALYSPFSKAEQRASTLLKEWLTREQCIQYQRLGYFEVTGSHSGSATGSTPAVR